jgi:hypothetical protein
MLCNDQCREIIIFPSKFGILGFKENELDPVHITKNIIVTYNTWTLCTNQASPNHRYAN